MKHDGSPAGGVPGKCHFPGIAAKVGDVPLNPLEDHALVPQPGVPGQSRISRAQETCVVRARAYEIKKSTSWWQAHEGRGARSSEPSSCSCYCWQRGTPVLNPSFKGPHFFVQPYSHKLVPLGIFSQPTCDSYVSLVTVKSQYFHLYNVKVQIVNKCHHQKNNKLSNVSKVCFQGNIVIQQKGFSLNLLGTGKAKHKMILPLPHVNLVFQTSSGNFE